MVSEVLKCLIRLKNYSAEQLAEETGVERESIQKLMDGTESCLDDGVLYVLKRFFGVRETCNAVHEPEPAYNMNRKYTLDDYYRLPDDRRVELIDGKFYDMAAPTIIHQTVQLKLASRIDRYIEEKGGPCRVFAAPTDVQLDSDEHTMVQPDVLIVCKPEKIGSQHITGAPDFVAEILSPSTGEKDKTTKLTKYRNAGVREYWMIDTEKEHIIVYDFEKDSPPAIYRAKDCIPVGIYKGDLTICFQDIFREIRKYE